MIKALRYVGPLIEHEIYGVEYSFIPEQVYRVIYNNEFNGYKGLSNRIEWMDDSIVRISDSHRNILILNPNIKMPKDFEVVDESRRT